MSNSNNQSRMDQYGVIEPTMAKPRSYQVGSKLSSGAGKDPVQPNKRGDQGTKG